MVLYLNMRHLVLGLLSLKPSEIGLFESEQFLNGSYFTFDFMVGIFGTTELALLEFFKLSKCFS
jgi:hypothetical protein